MKTLMPIPRGRLFLAITCCMAIGVAMPAISQVTTTNAQALATEEITGNIQGLTTAEGLMLEAKSNQDTQRLVQTDAITAQHNFAMSLPLCQAATQSTIHIAMEAAAQPARILRSDTNGNVTSGVQQPGDSAPPSQAAALAIKNRAALFCDPNDPVCKGVTVTLVKNGDRKPGIILALTRLESDQVKAEAAAIIQNLTQPIRVPALTAAQTSNAAGQDAYVRRGSYETMINLTKDVDTDILYTRREKIGDVTTYNQLAAEGGLAPATNGISLLDVENMRERDRFNANYHARVKGLEPADADREFAALLADIEQQDHRTNELLEQRQLLRSAVLALMAEPKMQAAAGTLR
jgi:hypothetical protein